MPRGARAAVSFPRTMRTDEMPMTSAVRSSMRASSSSSRVPRSSSAATSASSAASRSRRSASSARRRAREARLPTTTAVVRYTASASQFRLSASVSVWVGGRKKKLKASMLATATGTAYLHPQATATGRTANT